MSALSSKFSTVVTPLLKALSNSTLFDNDLLPGKVIYSKGDELLESRALYRSNWLICKVLRSNLTSPAIFAIGSRWSFSTASPEWSTVDWRIANGLCNVKDTERSTKDMATRKLQTNLHMTDWDIVYDQLRS